MRMRAYIFEGKERRSERNDATETFLEMERADIPGTVNFTEENGKGDP